MTDRDTAERTIEPPTDSDGPIARARADGRDRLLEFEAKELLSDAGISVPDHEVVSTPDEAVAAATRIGLPVVLKVSATEVQHKSEWGGGAGVAVSLTDEDDIRRAAERILDTADREGLEADVLVEAAADVDSGTEVIVGGVRDPSFGPTVLFGIGGVFTEVFEDVSHRIAPVSEREAREMLDEIDGTDLLDGYRGRPPADRDAIVTAITTVGDLLDANEAIEEIEINPLLVGDDSETIALDALVTL